MLNSPSVHVNGTRRVQTRNKSKNITFQTMSEKKKQTMRVKYIKIKRYRCQYCCSYNILASFWGCFNVLRRLISVFYIQKLNHYNTFRLPVFFHELLEISPSGLGSETETSSQRVFLRTKSVIWGDLSGCQGLWIGFKVDTFKFLCRQKNMRKLTNVLFLLH